MARLSLKKSILIGVWELVIIALFAVGFKLVENDTQPVLATPIPPITIASSVPITRVLPTIAATPSPTNIVKPELKPSSTNLPTATPIRTFTRYVLPTRTATTTGSTGTLPIPVEDTTGTVPIPVDGSTVTPPTSST